MKRFVPLSAVFTLSVGLLALPAFAQTDVPPSPATQSDAPPPPPPPPGDREHGPHGPGGGMEHRVEHLQHALNLSPDQTTQVRALLAQERTQMEALRANGSAAGSDRHQQVMAIHKDTETKLHGILTTDQAAKYDAMEARMRERRDAGSPPPPPPPGAEPPSQN